MPRILLIVAAAVLLAGCVPTGTAGPSRTPHAGRTPHVTATASASPTPSATPTPSVANAADYLLEGTPGVFDSDGEWDGHWGFYTDATKAVRCDMFVASGDVGGVQCAITPGHQRAYSLPAGVPSTCQFTSDAGYQLDGNVVAFDVQALGDGKDVGFEGCMGENDNPDIDAATKVLPPNTLLSVYQKGEFSCSVSAGVASCKEGTDGGSTFVFGLSVASWVQGVVGG